MDGILFDIQSEIQLFFSELNWTYIMLYSFIIYGIKYKEEFQWYNNLLEGTKVEPFKLWIAGIFTYLTFIIFKYFESGISVFYVSSILRSWIVVIVFNSILSDRIKKIKDSANN
jgi:hypothetical protein